MGVTSFGWPRFTLDMIQLTQFSAKHWRPSILAHLRNDTDYDVRVSSSQYYRHISIVIVT